MKYKYPSLKSIFNSIIFLNEIFWFSRKPLPLNLMKFQGNGNSGFIKPKGDKMMKKFLLAVLITILLVIFTVGCVEEPETETVEPTTSEPTVNKEAELQKAIDRGKELFNDPTLGTTGDTCNSCHLNGGKSPNTEKNIGTFNNLNTVYPKYFQMTSKVMSLDQVNNFLLKLISSQSSS